MPWFEFECDKCGFKFEHIMSHKMKEHVINSECPKCEKGCMKSIISSSNFKINGYSEANGYTKPGKRT
jgi:putative FmdB family regulatory protein